MIDTSPGSLDGPPVQERPGIGELIGRGIGVLAIVVTMVFLIVAMAWGIAWMVTHFPGV